MIIHRMTLFRQMSLTPDFSRVLQATHAQQPFQRFPSDAVQAVERALTSLGIQHTWMKPDVNDIAIFLVSHSL